MKRKDYDQMMADYEKNIKEQVQRRRLEIYNIGTSCSAKFMLQIDLGIYDGKLKNEFHDSKSYLRYKAGTFEEVFSVIGWLGYSVEKVINDILEKYEIEVELFKEQFDDIEFFKIEENKVGNRNALNDYFELRTGEHMKAFISQNKY